MQDTAVVLANSETAQSIAVLAQGLMLVIGAILALFKKK